jgi:putative ABC transport system ATP-binding protein
MHMAMSQGSDGATATPGAIALIDVRRRYSLADNVTVDALAELSLTIDPGSAVALSGPSGSGKSTLLHLIGALDRPDEGTVSVDGIDLATLRPRELAALTAIDNVVAPLLPIRTSFDKYARARELLDAVGLAGREQQLPARLSGGEQQRVALARALINDPSIVLADEPTGNLDSHTGEAIIDLLLTTRARLGITLVIATHDLAVASRCDRVIRLVDGRVRDDLDIRMAADPSATLSRLRRTA